MQVIEQAIGRLSKALAILAGVCVLLMMTHVTMDVVMKFAFNHPIENTIEIVSQYYMVAAVFLPLAVVEIRQEHIVVDLFVRKFPPSISRITYIFSSLLTAFFYFLLMHQSYITAMRSTMINEVMMGSSYVAIWPSRWFLPVGFGAVGLAILLHIVRTLLRTPGFPPYGQPVEGQS